MEMEKKTEAKTEDEAPEGVVPAPTLILYRQPREECAEFCVSRAFIASMGKMGLTSYFLEGMSEDFDCEKLELYVIYWIPWCMWEYQITMMEENICEDFDEVINNNESKAAISKISLDNDNGGLTFFCTRNAITSSLEEDDDCVLAIAFVSTYVTLYRSWASLGRQDTLAVSVEDATTGEVYLAFDAPYGMDVLFD